MIQDNDTMEVVQEQSSEPHASSEVTTNAQTDRPLPDVDKNFVELRRQHHRALQEKEELRQRLSQYEASNKQEDPEDIAIGDEDIAEGKHLKQVYKQQKKILKDIEALKQKTAEDIIDGKIRNRFPDFDAVVNMDTIKVLAEEDPELAYTIQSSPDNYNRAVLAYKEIKRRGISPNTTYDSDKKRAQDNIAKPRPLVSVSPQQGDSPLSNANAFANGLTPELKRALLKEMNDSTRDF